MLAEVRISGSGLKSNHSRRIEQMQEPAIRAEPENRALLT